MPRAPYFLAAVTTNDAAVAAAEIVDHVVLADAGKLQHFDDHAWRRGHEDDLAGILVLAGPQIHFHFLARLHPRLAHARAAAGLAQHDLDDEGMGFGGRRRETAHFAGFLRRLAVDLQLSLRRHADDQRTGLFGGILLVLPPQRRKPADHQETNQEPSSSFPAANHGTSPFDASAPIPTVTSLGRQQGEGNRVAPPRARDCQGWPLA